MGRREMDSRTGAVGDHDVRAGQTPASPWVASRLQRYPGSQRNCVADAIARVHGGSVVARDDASGVVRLTIVVSKQQLRQMVHAMGGSERSGTCGSPQTTAPPLSSPSTAQALDQILHVLRRRRHSKKAALEKHPHRGAWTPGLQSIPEEM